MNDQIDSAGEGPKWWSRAVQIGAVISVVLLLLGPLGTKFGIFDFRLGLMLCMGAVVLAALALFGCIVGFLVARSRGYAADKPLAGIGAVLGALVLGVMGQQFMLANSVPPIHNISTDVNDPPVFNAIASIRAQGEYNPLDYDAEVLAPQQAAAYPFLRSIETDLDREAAFNRARGILEDMGLEIVAAEAGGRLIEATYESFWFGFKDDVVVRIRPAGSGSLIDLRSVSRVGQSDLGANARRIGAFIDQFEGA